MPYPETPLRLARRVGRRAEAVIMWSGQCGTWTLHRAAVAYAPGYEGDRIPPGWRDVIPETCERCGAPFDPAADPKWSGSLRIEWDTPSGRLEPGCVRLQEPDHNGLGPEACSGDWTNCDGRHVLVTLPNGIEWDVDSRARNCTRQQDTEHRCWVRTGDPEHPETLHVTKDGNTCSAGAGSIAAGDYHGFLQHGVLTAG